MASNRFAGLAPDFEEEEGKRRQAAEEKAKKEAQRQKQTEERPRDEGRPEGGRGFVPRPVRGAPGMEQRGRGRGMGRGRGQYRARGSYYPSGGEASYDLPRQKAAPREAKNPRFMGTDDPIHPFDRKSGTGRGTEVSKAGAGTANWGRPEDDIENMEKFPLEEVVPGAAEEKHEAAALEEGKAVEEPAGKRERKMKKRYGGREEEEKVPEFETEGSMTYEEYRQQVAGLQTGLPVKKPEAKIDRDPKSAGLVAYAKPQESETKSAAKRREVPRPEAEEESEEEKAKKAEVLGAFIGEERRGFRGGIFCSKHHHHDNRKKRRKMAAERRRDGKRTRKGCRAGQGGEASRAANLRHEVRGLPLVLKTNLHDFYLCDLRSFEWVTL